jgi:hypothetical protein
LAEPHVTAVTDQPSSGEPAASQPFYQLLAIALGLALIVAAASNQAVSLSSQLVPQLPAPRIPAVRVLVAVVGACPLVWGLWGLLGPALMQLAGIRRRPAPAAARADELAGSAGAPSLPLPIAVRLRAEHPLVVDLDSVVPSVSIWLEINSHSDVDAVLDRIVVDFWAGQPVLTGVMAHRHRVARHSTVENVYFCGQLTPGAVERIRQEMAKTAPRGRYTVYATAYFDSSEGAFEVQPQRLEREIPPPS